MYGHPGDINVVLNYYLHYRIEDLVSGKYWNDEEVLTEILDELEYRLDMIRFADRYVEYLGLSGPKGQKCAT